RLIAGAPPAKAHEPDVSRLGRPVLAREQRVVLEQARRQPDGIRRARGLALGLIVGTTVFVEHGSLLPALLRFVRTAPTPRYGTPTVPTGSWSTQPSFPLIASEGQSLSTHRASISEGQCSARRVLITCDDTGVARLPDAPRRHASRVVC